MGTPEGGSDWSGFEDGGDVDLPEGSEPEDVTTGDFDGDGDDDIATANSGSDSVGISQNQGGSGKDWNGMGEAEEVGLAEGADPGSVQPGDLDNDKDLDLTTGDRGRGTVSIIVNGMFATAGGESEIILEPSAPLSVNPQPTSIALVDLGEDEGSSDLDIAIAVLDPETGDRIIQILRNDTIGSQIAYTDAAMIFPADDALFVLGGDVDNDGSNDIVSVDQTASPESVALVGSGSGVSVFLGHPIDLNNQCNEDVSGDGVVNSLDLNIILVDFGCDTGDCQGDTDGDGDTDSTDLNNVLEVFGDVCPCSEDINNNGTVGSADLNILLADFGCTGLCVADVDGDGDVDSGDLNQLLELFGQACP